MRPIPSKPRRSWCVAKSLGRSPRDEYIEKMRYRYARRTGKPANGSKLSFPPAALRSVRRLRSMSIPASKAGVPHALALAKKLPWSLISLWRSVLGCLSKIGSYVTQPASTLNFKGLCVISKIFVLWALVVSVPVRSSHNEIERFPCLFRTSCFIRRCVYPSVCYTWTG